MSKAGPLAQPHYWDVLVHLHADVVILNAGIMEAEDYTGNPVLLDVVERTTETTLDGTI
ncbi:hypothetical protein [Pseudoruegeria sp. SK021]|uniref:hypothetical protein n=1 Tax=Pseudoruegeria sp. SK021 TaxID=1933035 RepID=UPI001F0ADA8C|nr:hypothetical protein [Pseudoruegeria sp. SK021]